VPLVPLVGDAWIGRGAGTELIAALAAEVRQHAGAGLRVGPDASNTASRRMLEKDGFGLVAARPIAPNPATRRSPSAGGSRLAG
jgi:L-amino acid N-acyltransferase YncA